MPRQESFAFAESRVVASFIFEIRTNFAEKS
jgi:hypothetical protein